MRIFGALALTLVLFASRAHAQDAASLVAEGIALRREGRDAEAAERFRAAHAIDGSARTLAQLALAEQGAGRWVDAERHLVAALAMDDAWIAEHRAVLEAALATIRSHVGRLSVEANVQGAELFLDGERVGTLPIAEPLATEVGTHVVELRAPGHVPVQRSTEVRAGVLSRVTLAMVPSVAQDAPRVAPEAPSATPTVAPRDEPQREPPSSSGPSPLLVAGVVGAGVTALTLVATVVAIGVREASVQLWNDPSQCPASGPNGRLEACASTYGTIWSAQDWAIGLGVGTAVSAVVSGVLLTLGLTEPPVRASVGTSGAHVELLFEL